MQQTPYKAISPASYCLSSRSFFAFFVSAFRRDPHLGAARGSQGLIDGAFSGQSKLNLQVCESESLPSLHGNGTRTSIRKQGLQRRRPPKAPKKDKKRTGDSIPNPPIGTRFSFLSFLLLRAWKLTGFLGEPGSLVSCLFLSAGTDPSNLLRRAFCALNLLLLILLIMLLAIHIDPH